MTQSPPDVGQMVTVRERDWIVTDILANALPDRPQHLVDLVSIDDGAHGETLQVLWQIEPGAAASSQSTLPDMSGFDPPERLDAFLDAVRWGSIASANVKRLQSPFRAGIKIEDYQLVPVNRALTMPRVNLLIADDVGLGKTIEAGLVMLELILRHRAQSIMVVCPPSLQIQWRDQMQEKFGLRFQIVDREYFREVRRTRGIHSNPWKSFPRLITSIDFLKRDGPMRRMMELLPSGNQPRYPRHFDLLVVDEAHNVAPSGGGRYQHASARTRAIRDLTPHFEHKLFLSATPHNGYSVSFWALLELLDDQRFARAVKPDPKQVDAVMIRRLKTQLEVGWDGKPRFAPRQLEAIEVTYSDTEREIHRLLAEYGRMRREAAENDTAAQMSVEFVLKTLKKRLFSSPAAFARTIERHIHTIDNPGLKPRVKPALRDLRNRFLVADEPIESDTEAEETTVDAFAEVEDISPVTPAARAILLRLRDWADDAASQPDRKALALLAWLKSHVAQNDERVIVFTEYRDTQNWLLQLLASAGLTQNGLTMQIFGSMDRDGREAVKAAFQADPSISPVRILLATDAASEGLDFQNYCHQVIHYEIPWNPNRLEQRNGRVDRHGQQADKVLIHHFVGAGYDRSDVITPNPENLDDDLEFLFKIATKTNQIRQDLGSAGTVLASRVERAMLGEAATWNSLEDLGSDNLSQSAARDMPLAAAHDEIAAAFQTLEQTRTDLDIDPARIRRGVETALELAGQPPLVATTIDGHPAWHIPAMQGSWAETRVGLEHPFRKTERPIIFDRAVAETMGDDVVHAHLHHPLVQRCLRLLRAALWGRSEFNLHRVTVRVVDDSALDTPAILAHGRLVVTGGDGHRLHEQIITTSGLIRSGRFSRLNVGQTNVLLAATTYDLPVPATLWTTFQNLWPAIEPSLQSALENRQENLVTSLLNDVRQRQRQETIAIRTVLTELEAMIERELRTPDTLQLDLFSGDDLDQVEGDRNALEERLARIPEELEQELTAIEVRYADIEPRLFPVSVTWLVPRSIVLQHGA